MLWFLDLLGHMYIYQSLAVTKIKSDSNYFFRYDKKLRFCASETGPLYDKKIHLLTSDKLEMCTLLL